MESAHSICVDPDTNFATSIDLFAQCTETVCEEPLCIRVVTDIKRSEFSAIDQRSQPPSDDFTSVCCAPNRDVLQISLKAQITLKIGER